ncbi:MAG: class I SAM-dependent methyltransferase [Actinobacteria bacterium]|nr:class I SAM-dependent methyltransferase [Actinomycetota bacterium]
MSQGMGANVRSDDGGSGMADRSVDEQKALSRERFAPRASDYRESAPHAAGPDLDLLVAWLEPKPAEHALDVATGGGHVALALARTGADVDACDLTPEMLDAAAALLAANDCTAAFAVGEADALPYADASFDIVACRIAAHHFPDAPAFFAEVMRVLKPGGRFGFQDQTLPPEPTSAVFNDTFERVRDASHNQSYSKEGWITLIERAGLHVERHELVDKQLDFAEWTQRQGCDDACIGELCQMMDEAPAGMRRWLEPEWEDGELVAFRNRHLVVLARKP